jgi:hypothetical protein
MLGSGHFEVPTNAKDIKSRTFSSPTLHVAKFAAVCKRWGRSVTHRVLVSEHCKKHRHLFRNLILLTAGIVPPQRLPCLKLCIERLGRSLIFAALHLGKWRRAARRKSPAPCRRSAWELRLRKRKNVFCGKRGLTEARTMRSAVLFAAAGFSILDPVAAFLPSLHTQGIALRSAHAGMVATPVSPALLGPRLQRPLLRMSGGASRPRQRRLLEIRTCRRHLAPYTVRPSRRAFCAVARGDADADWPCLCFCCALHSEAAICVRAAPCPSQELYLWPIIPSLGLTPSALHPGLPAPLGFDALTVAPF